LPKLKPRDFQLLADLERAFQGQSFLLKSERWTDFECRASLATMPGDEASVDRLVAEGKVVDLGSINRERHFAIKKKET
jgi:hypothetical protein